MESLKPISELLKQDLLDSFKIGYSDTLFPPNWEALKINRCPLCSNLLKFPHNKSIAYCKGKKHAKNFSKFWWWSLRK